MPREAKFNFMPAVYNRKNTKSIKSVVSISSHGTIVFNRASIEEYGLNGKYLKFFIDPSKKALGWTIIDTFNDLSDLKKKEYRKIKPTSYGSCSLSIKSILSELNPDNKKFSQLKIGNYKDSMYGIIYFIKLTKSHETNKRD